MALYRTFGAAALITLAGIVPANALTMSGVGAECAGVPIPGIPTIALDCGNGDRANAGNVNMGAADGNFYSLGRNVDGSSEGGAIAFEILPGFTGPITVTEATNPGTNHWEAAEVYVGTSISDLVAEFNSSNSIGIVHNGKGGIEPANNVVQATGVYTHILFVDVSLGLYGDVGNGTVDGFDLDSFTVEPLTVSQVPLPAGFLLLGTALAGLGIARRRS